MIDEEVPMNTLVVVCLYIDVLDFAEKWYIQLRSSLYHLVEFREIASIRHCEHSQIQTRRQK